jgi:antibiotic biosynthesis monooxygenase (ABM) superfamily enzyme
MIYQKNEGVEQSTRKDDSMIKVIVGYRLKSGADIIPILLKLRSGAMTYPGFIASENLLSEQDISIVATVSTWQRVEDWRLWESSRTREEILREAEVLLAEEPKVTLYTIMPTIRWTG